MAPIDFTFDNATERTLFWMALGQDLDRSGIPTRNDLEDFVTKADITSPRSPVMLALVERVRAHLLIPEGPIGAPGMGPPIAHQTSPVAPSAPTSNFLFTPEWFDSLNESDPGVFYIGSKKFVFLDRPRRTGGIFILTKNEAGDLCVAFLNPLGPEFKKTEPAVMAIRDTQKLGAARHLGTDDDVSFDRKNAEGFDQIRFNVAGEPFIAILRVVTPSTLNLADGVVTMEADHFSFKRPGEEPIIYRQPIEAAPLSLLWFERLTDNDPGVLTIGKEKILVLEIEETSELVLIGQATPDQLALTLLGDEDHVLVDRIRHALKVGFKTVALPPHSGIDLWTDAKGARWTRGGFLLDGDTFVASAGKTFRITLEGTRGTITDIDLPEESISVKVPGVPDEKVRKVPPFTKKWFDEISENHPSVFFIEDGDQIKKYIYLSETRDLGFALLTTNDQDELVFSPFNISAHFGILEVIQAALLRTETPRLITHDLFVRGMKVVKWETVAEFHRPQGYQHVIGKKKNIRVRTKIAGDRIESKISPAGGLTQVRSYELTDNPFPTLIAGDIPPFTRTWFDALGDSHPAVVNLRSQAGGGDMKAVFLEGDSSTSPVFGLFAFGDEGAIYFGLFNKKAFSSFYQSLKKAASLTEGRGHVSLDDDGFRHFFRYERKSDGVYVPIDSRLERSDQIELRIHAGKLWVIEYSEDGIGATNSFKIYEPKVEAAPLPAPQTPGTPGAILEALREGTKIRRMQESPSELAKRVRAGLSLINNLRTNLRVLPLQITTSTVLGKVFAAASKPIPITTKISQPGVSDFRTFRRQRTIPASASVNIRWGLEGSNVEYSITGGAGNFNLEPKGPGPGGTLQMIYQEGSGVHLTLDENTEIYRWLDQEINGPKLTVEWDGMDDAPKLVFKVTGDLDGSLIQAVQELLIPLTSEGAAFIQEPVVDGNWRGEIVYQPAQTSLVLDKLKAISHAYLESLQKERKPSWVVPLGVIPAPSEGLEPGSSVGDHVQGGEFSEIGGVPGTGSPLPEVTPGGDDIDHHTSQVLIDLNHFIDTGLPGVEITFGTLESKTTGDKIFFVEQVKIRGQIFKDDRHKFPIELKEEIDIPVIRETSEHAGWERFILHIKPDMTAEVSAYEYISLESRTREVSVQPTILKSDGNIDDPAFIDLKYVANPITSTEKLVSATLRPIDAINYLLGDRLTQPTLATNLPLGLKEGAEIVFDLPLVGEVAYTLRKIPSSGGWGLERQALEYYLDIKTDHLGQASLLGSNGQKDQTFGLERISKKRGAHYFATEERYILRQAEIPRFRAWLHILGHPLAFDPAQHTDLEIIVITERGPARKISHKVEKIIPFARNPDGTLPVRALQLDGAEYALLTAALSGIEPHPAASGEAVQVLKLPQTPFFSTDHLKIAAGSVFLPTKETLDFIKKAFFEKKEGIQPFKEGEKIEQRLEFANEEGLVISIPVIWTNRHRNPFRLDVDGRFKLNERGETATDGRGVAVVGLGRRIEYYIRGHKRKTRKPVDYSFRAHDEGGYWTFYEMTAIDDQKVKAFNLSVVINRHSPVLMSLVNTLNEAGVEDNAVTLRQNARDQLDRHLDKYFEQNLSELPPIYLPDRQLTYREGKPIALAFISDPETTPIRKAELSGFRLERGSRRLDFDPILRLKIEKQPQGGVEGEAPIRLGRLEGATRAPINDEAIKLRHTAQSGADAVLLVEILPDGSSGRNFIWNIGLGVVVEQKKGDAGPIDREKLLLLIQKSGFPLTTFSTDADDVGAGKKPSVQMRGGTIVGTDVAIPVIDESASGFSVPSDKNIDPVVKPADVDKLLEGFFLHDEIFIPAEATVFAQTLIGREEEVMTFITQSGIILQIPMKAEVKSPYRYLANEVADSVYGIRGSRLLIPDPQKNGHYYELTAKAVHEKTHSGRNRESIELQILGNRKVNFRLNQVSSSETFSKKTVFGFHCVQVGVEPVVTQANARAELKAWIDYLNMNRAPDMASVGEGKWAAETPTIKLNDGRQVELKVVKVDEHHYRLTEIIADEGFGDRAPKAILHYWDQGGGPKHYEVYRSADDSALYYLFDPETKKYSYLVLSAEGNLWIWNRRSHIREFLSPPQSVNFPMVGIEGKVYTSGASSVATRVAIDPPPSMGGGVGEGGHEHFEITAIMGRWDGATPKSFTADAGGKIARVRLMVTIAEDGTLSVAPGKIRDVEREGGANFPWGEEFKIELVEDRVGGHIRIVFSQGSHYGWMAFNSREELVGAAENFRVSRAHYHESKQFADRKLHLEDRGFLTKRAGVHIVIPALSGGRERESSAGEPEQGVSKKISGVPDTGSPLPGITQGGDDMLFRALQQTEKGRAILEAFKSTEARAADLPILLGAMEYLGLIDDDGKYDESLLVSLAAFAADQNPGVQRTEIVKPPVRRRDRVKLVGGTTVQQPVRLVGSVPEVDDESGAQAKGPGKKGKKPARGVRTTTAAGTTVITPRPPVTILIKK